MAKTNTQGEEMEIELLSAQELIFFWQTKIKAGMHNGWSHRINHLLTTTG
jgi:hypothetical protein